MLVYDLSLGTLPGMPSSNNIDFDFAYEWNESHSGWMYPAQERVVSTWLRHPPVFPTFAKFAEGIEVPENGDDTGRLLRMLLPFQDAQSRETISQYSGNVLVLDARVSCQRLSFKDLHINEFEQVGGTFSRTKSVSGLFGPMYHVPFHCSVQIPGENGYGLSIFQVLGVEYGGVRLLSDLRDVNQWLALEKILDTDDLAGGTYLIFEITDAGEDMYVGNKS